MAFLAQWLPVLPIPEQFTVSPVRNDVIHDRRLPVPSLGETFDTEWMDSQELLADALPGSAVAAG